MFRVSDIREDLASNVMDAGKCKDSKAVLDYINAARRLLYPLGDWVGVIKDLRVCAYNGLLTLPSEYETIRRASTCFGETVIDNHWWENADNLEWGDASGTPELPSNRFIASRDCYNMLKDLGKQYALYRDYESQFRLIVKGTNAEDEGKEIEFTGLNSLGHRLASKIKIGGGHELVYGNDWWKSVSAANKTRTEGAVYVYIFNPNNCNEIIEAGVYEGTDSNIQMRRYRVPVYGNMSRMNQFFVRVKKQYRPLVDESEEVDFSTDSLIHACNAVTQRRNKMNKEYAESITLATGVLNHEIKDTTVQTGGRIRMSRHNLVHNL